jgi:nucleoside-diphosphate-sugar epimerase
MKYFVSGATGFIGQQLLDLLCRHGHTVHALARTPFAVDPVFADKVKVFIGDVCNPEILKNGMKGCDGVFHLAAYARNWARIPRTFHDINVGGLRTILEASIACSVKRVVFTSSALTLGPSNGIPVDGTAERTHPAYTEYERSKCEAEKLASHYAQQGLHIVTVNPTRVFGPGLLNEGNSVTRMIDWYLRGKWRFILGDGNAIGNYTFVQDVARGHLGAMEHGRSGMRYVLGGEDISLNGFFNLVSAISNTEYRLFHVPGRVALTYAAIEELIARISPHHPLITPGWVRVFMDDWACDSKHAITEIGYRITPLVEALSTTLDWLKAGQRDRILDIPSISLPSATGASCNGW